MNPRERFLNQALGHPIDRGVLWEDRYWPETWTRWLGEGMPPEPGFGFDFPEMASHDAVDADIGFCPPYPHLELEDRGDRLLIQDEYGVHKLIWKNGTGMPRFERFPVTCRADWEKLIPRLSADAPGRFRPGWENRLRSAVSNGAWPTTFGRGHLCGFFSFLRELAGDECYLLFYDDPDLARDMVAFQAERLRALLMRAAAAAPVDRLFIWEDMAYKNGPLIGPDLFREFLLPGYAALIAAARHAGVRVIDLDSDGRTDELIPIWLEAGVNMMHPFEAQAGMDVNRIRREYGGGFAMRGGVDKRALAGDRAAIDAELERIRPAYEQGRYIPHVDHSVPPDVSYANYRYYLNGLSRLIGK